MKLMRGMKKTLLAAALAVVASTGAFAEITFGKEEACAARDGNSPFAVSWLLDAPVLAGNALGAGSAYVVKKTASFTPYDSSMIFDLSTVNALDAFFAQPYNHTLHQVGTVTCGIDLALLPAGVFATEAILGNLPWTEAGKICLMYAESFLLSYTIKDHIKMAVQRPRPYMYFENPSQKGISSNDWQFSFPSGHTTNAFLGAGFLSYVFCQYYPESKFKIPVIATAYTLAVGTGALRVMSGNHFVTDVLTGAAIGTFCGIGIPLLHHVIAEDVSSSGFARNVSVSPLGVYVSFNF